LNLKSVWKNKKLRESKSDIHVCILPIMELGKISMGYSWQLPTAGSLFVAICPPEAGVGVTDRWGLSDKIQWKR